MEIEFSGPVFEWRGPAPYHFVRMPPDDSADLKEAAAGLQYWGCLPARVRIGETRFTTALIPREGCFFVPIKDAVRRAEGLVLGDVVDVWVAPGKE